MTRYDKVPYEQIVIVTTEHVCRPFTVLQTVSGWGPSIQDAENAMKRQAAELHADAIIGTRYQHRSATSPASCSGRAIVYK